MVTKTKRAARVFVKGDILQYLSERPGRTIHREELARALGVDAERITRSIGNILVTTSDSAKDHVEVCIAGKAWQWSEQSLSDRARVTAEHEQAKHALATDAVAQAEEFKNTVLFDDFTTEVSKSVKNQVRESTSTDMEDSMRIFREIGKTKSGRIVAKVDGSNQVYYVSEQ